jgi:hypothetical protein
MPDWSSIWLTANRLTHGTFGAGVTRGGLQALLQMYRPAGTPLSRPPEGVAAIAQALRQPVGCASDAALRPWVRQTSHLQVNSHPLYARVRTRFKATLKVPRPSHPQKP